MYLVLYLYNIVGFLICLFLASRTTPGHYFYEYSKILVSLNMYQHIPFFWDVAFYSSLVFSFYFLFDSIRELGGFSSTFLSLFDFKSHSNQKVSHFVCRILNSLFCILCWSFIKFYRAERDKSHEEVLRHQQMNEYEFLRNKCLKIR